MICHEVHVSIRKSRRRNYLGPFKGAEPIIMVNKFGRIFVDKNLKFGRPRILSTKVAKRAPYFWDTMYVLVIALFLSSAETHKLYWINILSLLHALKVSTASFYCFQQVLLINSDSRVEQNGRVHQP